MMPKLPEPDLYVHELICNNGGIFLGCSNLDVVKQAHTDGETSEKIDTLFLESSVRAIQEEAYRAGMAAAVPEGWKLVPVEPTQAMVVQGAGIIDDNGGNARWGDIREAWDAMLSASPEVKSAINNLLKE